jgi:nucleotide-binding universal stress UspA family protein
VRCGSDPHACFSMREGKRTRVAGRLRADSLNVVCRAVEGRPAGATIARIAGEEHVQFIAMATHGREGLARLVLGSVGTEVLRHANTPVLLVHPACLTPISLRRTSV